MPNEAEQKYAANQEAQLQAMAQTEMRDMEFACEECPNSFRYRDDLEKHLIMRHGFNKETARQTMRDTRDALRKAELDRRYPEGGGKKKGKPRGRKHMVDSALPPHLMKQLDEIKKDVDEETPE